MLNEVFKESQQAEVTIKVGDYVVTVAGEMSPPVVDTNRFQKDFYSFSQPGQSKIPNINEISFKLEPSTEVKAERWRWTIPVAIPARIEEDA